MGVPPYCGRAESESLAGTKWDTMNDGPNNLASIPSTVQEFGAVLKRLSPASVRELEARQHRAGGLVLSKSSLQRYQDGSQLPKLEHADHLDDLYGAHGWVSTAIRSLHGAAWDPWAKEHGVASLHHAFTWPAWHHGLVWISLKPLPRNVSADHVITLTWGPWDAVVALTLPAEGQILVTGKSEDKSGHSVTLNLDSGPPVFALHGAGPAPSPGDVVDIRRRWFHHDIDPSEGKLRVRPFGSISRPRFADALPRPRPRRRVSVTSCNTTSERDDPGSARGNSAESARPRDVRKGRSSADRPFLTSDLDEPS